MKKIVLNKLFVLGVSLFMAGFAFGMSTDKAGAAELNLGKINIGGALEVQTYIADIDDDSYSDIILNTAEIDVDIDFSQNIAGKMIFLWEEDSDRIDLDVGTITLKETEYFPISLTAGRFYVPFGVYNTHFISAPLTSELGETRESTVIAEYNISMFEFSGGIFNGSDDDGRVDDLVLSVKMTPREKIQTGISFITDIGGTDAQFWGTGAGSTETISGISVFASAEVDSYTIEFEYLSALDDLTDNAGNQAEPMAWNVELAYKIDTSLEVGVKLEGTKDFSPMIAAGNDGDDVIQFGLVGSYKIAENIKAGAEYLHGEGDSSNVDWDIITANLVLEF